MGTQLTHMSEDYAISRPPLFVGTSYIYWRKRMEIFMQSIDYELWEIMTQGPLMPKRELLNEDGSKIVMPKERDEFTREDLDMLTKNSKALHILTCGLDDMEFTRVSGCSTAFEAWKVLEAIHGGSTQMVESFTSKLEEFKMEDEESLDQMFLRFVNIVNNLSSCGVAHSNGDLNRILLSGLREEFNSQALMIKESYNLDTTTIHEVMVVLNMEEDLARLKRSFDEASSVQESEEEDDEENVGNEELDEESDQSDQGDGLAPLIDEFTSYAKFISKGNESGSSNQGSKQNVDKIESPIMTYVKKKKAMLSCWDDDSSEEEDGSDECGNNVCLMTNHHHEVSTNSSMSLMHDDISLKDIQKAFSSLHENFTSLQEREKDLVAELHSEKKRFERYVKSIEDILKLNDEFAQENLDLLNRVKSLEEENLCLRAKTKDLHGIVLKFTKGQESFDKMLGSQKLTFDKCGIGFESTSKQKLLKNIFVKPSHTSHHVFSHMYSKLKCTYCERDGHGASDCFYRKQLELGSLVPPWKRQVWIVKQKANPSGPKPPWVPKA